MPYRNDQEAWLRRNEEAEARAEAAEATLRDLASMKAKAPWRHAFVALIVLSLGITAGWQLAPAEHQPGFFAALTTQSFASRNRSLYVWRATPHERSELASEVDECRLSVDVQDNDGVEDRPVREIHMRVACRGGFTFTTSDFAYGERRIGGCSVETGEQPSLFCTLEGRNRGVGTRLFVNTRTGMLRIRRHGVDASFDITPLEHIHSGEDPAPVRGRGVSQLQSAATITHVSGIPSEGFLARPRIRVGAECTVTATSADSAPESRCEVEIDCAGSGFEANGVCTLDERGQIERVVDLTVSAPDGQRGDGNASVIFDVSERQLVLMESEGHEAFLVQLSLESSRSRARFL